MRPRTLDEFLGQETLLGPGRPLRLAIEQDRLQSIILWGPPGTGKTTLARLIATLTRAHFIAFSAVLSGIKEIRAVMPGKVVAVLVDVGASVEQGQGVLVIEAMKMENEIKAQRSGSVKEIRVTPGQAVEAGELLAVIDD